MLSMLALAACDRLTKVQPPVASEAAPLVVEGRPNDIARFEEEARECGLARLERSRKSARVEWLTISGLPPEPPGPGDPLSCALVWLYEHPETDLHVVGNAPRR